MITANQIRPLLRAAVDRQVADDLEAHVQGLRARREPLSLGVEDLDRILTWKLRGQYGRQQKLRAENTEGVVRAMTGTAFAIQHENPEYEIELKVNVLCALRGVGVPVASAILAIVEPVQYGVIDFRGWRQMFGEKKTNFSVADYKRYMAELRRLAQELRWRVRDVDEAIWEFDRRENGGKD